MTITAEHCAILANTWEQWCPDKSMEFHSILGLEGNETNKKSKATMQGTFNVELLEITNDGFTLHKTWNKSLWAPPEVKYFTWETATQAEFRLLNFLPIS